MGGNTIRRRRELTIFTPEDQKRLVNELSNTFKFVFLQRDTDAPVSDLIDKVIEEDVYFGRRKIHLKVVISLDEYTRIMENPTKKI